jgi:beta-lactamase class A
MKKILLLISFLFIGWVAQASAQTPEAIILQHKTQARLQHIIHHSRAVTGLEVIDLTNGKSVFSFNSRISFPQASAIKIPVLMTIFKQANQGKFNLSDKRTVKQADVVGGTGVLKEMKMPVSLSIRNICALMMSLSDNTAANVLIELAGMKSVNAVMKSLGFDKTVLRRKMMAIKASAEGRENLSTPADAARILKLLYDGKFINQKKSSKIISFMKKPARTESYLAAGLPDSVPMAFKYGGLKEVKTEWAIVLLQARPYAVAVMQNDIWDKKKDHAIKNISSVLYRYFWRLGHSTKYGVYRNPKFIKK